MYRHNSCMKSVCGSPWPGRFPPHIFHIHSEEASLLSDTLKSEIRTMKFIINN